MKNAIVITLALLVTAGGLISAAAQGAGPYFYNVGAMDYPVHVVLNPVQAFAYAAGLPELPFLQVLSGAVATDGSGHVDGLVYSRAFFDQPGVINQFGNPGGPYYQTNLYSAYTITVTGKVKQESPLVKLTLKGHGYDAGVVSNYPNASLSLNFNGNGTFQTFLPFPIPVSVLSNNYSITFADGHTETFTNGPVTKTNYLPSSVSGKIKGTIKPGKGSPFNGGKTLNIDQTTVLITATTNWTVVNDTNFVETIFGGGLIVDFLSHIDAQVIQPVPGSKLYLNANVGSLEQLCYGTGSAHTNTLKWSASLNGIAFARGSKLQAKGDLGPVIVDYVPTTDRQNFPSGYMPRIVRNGIMNMTITGGKIYGQTILTHGVQVQGISVPAIAPAADLAISKTHVGNFTQGDPNDEYTIAVVNIGPAYTVGTVSVVDALPAGLTAVDMSGPGWTATLTNLTCTRFDSLAPGASYPPITLTVSVATNAPASVTNTASVSGGGDVSSANNTASDPTTIIP